MRVLHLHSGNMYGGVETLLVTLARESGRVPDMAPAFALCFDGRLRHALTALGTPPFALPPVRLSRPHTVLRARRALRDLLAREGFDAVVCHQPWTCVVFGPVVRAAGFPLVLWAHMTLEAKPLIDRLARRLRPDLVICNSRFTMERVQEWLPGVSAELVYCPVSAPGGRERADARRSQVRRALDTPEGDVVVAIVSRFDALKGHDVLIESLAGLRSRPGWTCWIVGAAQGPAEQALADRLGRLADAAGIGQRVRFTGHRTDVGDVLAASDIYCQPNTGAEGFGLALVEALQAGLPVVTSAIGGALEIVDADCGRLVPPHDVEAVATALRQLIEDSDLRASLGRAAARRPAELCDPARQLRRLQQLLAVGRAVPVTAGAR